MSRIKKIKILKDVLGPYFQENHSQLLFSCPRCNHHKKKLAVNVEKNVFKCWVCDWSGRNLYTIIKNEASLSTRREWLSFDQQIEINNFVEKLFGEADEGERQKVELPKNFVSLVNKNLPSTATRPLNYLYSRGLTQKDIIRWKIGYCASGKFGGRVIIPSFDESGHLNYFIARSYDGSWKKYINPSFSKDIIFNELYVDFDKDVVLVEGVFDAVRAGENSIPILGSTLSENSHLLQKIVSHDTKVYLALDNDASKKTNIIINLLLRHNIDTYLIDTSLYDDVAEMPIKTFKQRKDESVAIDSDTHLLNRIINI